MKKYLIFVEDDADGVICDEWLTTADAIAMLNSVAERLRRPNLPQFDASFGEAPMPITGPSTEELSRFLNQAQRA